MQDLPEPENRIADDRSPFEAAVAVVRTIPLLSDRLPRLTLVWRKVLESKGEGFREYLRTIIRTRHSLFYHQIQELYEFGIAYARQERRDAFCYEAGRTFTRLYFSENIYRVLQYSFARETQYQRRVVEILREYVYRYTGSRYAICEEVTSGEIRFTLENRWPDAVAGYLRQHGLDPDRCFRNSFEFIAGAFEELLSRVIEGWDPTGFGMEIAGGRGTVHMPVPSCGSFACEALTRSLVEYIRDLKERSVEAAEEHEIERDVVIGTRRMKEVWDRIRRASKSDEIVLLTGESGTGKTLVARKIHDLSRRNGKPFVEVGMTSDIGSDNLVLSNLFGHERGAFTGAMGRKEGLFSLAEGGTIFLDEIGDASLEVQAKLLRVIETSTFKRLGGLEDRRVDVRIVAASNRDLEAMVRAASFRQDLYYRLNVITIRLPPLRERLEEIPAMADYLIARAVLRRKAPHRKLAAGLADRLRGYAWPGNIRELDHALKYALAMAEGSEIRERDFPDSIRRWLEGGAGSGREGGGAPPPVTSAAGIIEIGALREAIRGMAPLEAGGRSRPEGRPGHIEHAKRVYLEVLIDETGGDLAMIGRFWDRTSEKTLRKLIQGYGLGDRLEAARARERSRGQGGG